MSYGLQLQLIVKECIQFIPEGPCGVNEKHYNPHHSSTAAGGCYGFFPSGRMNFYEVDDACLNGGDSRRYTFNGPESELVKGSLDWETDETIRYTHQRFSKFLWTSRVAINFKGFVSTEFGTVYLTQEAPPSFPSGIRTVRLPISLNLIQWTTWFTNTTRNGCTLMTFTSKNR